ncbi:hypothetical protein FIBSPDRAFT_867986 [Athelia psychrophila]|uniref:Secreted protein n=1 Tax=Athelia psychrophila TaxID=1759441 RepID=A0A166DH21_9AGAM|nr:hypothetical protein FIBSPDRAFT_867986 [Fibularhizoctonia sp. CBS 109695]
MRLIMHSFCVLVLVKAWPQRARGARELPKNPLCLAYVARIVMPVVSPAYVAYFWHLPGSASLS